MTCTSNTKHAPPKYFLGLAPIASCSSLHQLCHESFQVEPRAASQSCLSLEGIVPTEKVTNHLDFQMCWGGKWT